MCPISGAMRCGLTDTSGGDHTIVLPILRALAEHHGRPIGVVHVDAHSDTNDHMFDEPIAHGEDTSESRVLLLAPNRMCGSDWIVLV